MFEGNWGNFPWVRGAGHLWIQTVRKGIVVIWGNIIHILAMSDVYVYISSAPHKASTPHPHLPITPPLSFKHLIHVYRRATSLQGGLGEVFANSDSVHVLTYAIMMLNTDQHSSQVKKKMMLREFFRNQRKTNNGSNFPEKFLSDVYSSISPVGERCFGEGGWNVFPPSNKDKRGERREREGDRGRGKEGGKGEERGTPKIQYRRVIGL